MILKKAREIKNRLNKVDEDKLKDVDLEKHDMLAMVIAAFITFLPPILIACAIIYFVLWLIFLRWYTDVLWKQDIFFRKIDKKGRKITFLYTLCRIDK